MYRSIFEGDTHSVLEGITIGAYAIGACKGYIYVRTEYPLAVANLSAALEQSRSLGLLGRNILGTDFSFDVEIFRGAGTEGLWDITVEDESLVKHVWIGLTTVGEFRPYAVKVMGIE